MYVFTNTTRRFADAVAPREESGSAAAVGVAFNTSIDRSRMFVEAGTAGWRARRLGDCGEATRHLGPGHSNAGTARAGRSLGKRSEAGTASEVTAGIACCMGTGAAAAGVDGARGVGATGGNVYGCGMTLLELITLAERPVLRAAREAFSAARHAESCASTSSVEGVV